MMAGAFLGWQIAVLSLFVGAFAVLARVVELTASTANSARGMPKVMATRSIANEPTSAWLPRT